VKTYKPGLPFTGDRFSGDVNHSFALTCPECKHQATLEGWDTLLADEGCVFCRECACQVVVESGKPIYEE